MKHHFVQTTCFQPPKTRRECKVTSSSPKNLFFTQRSPQPSPHLQFFIRPATASPPQTPLKRKHAPSTKTNHTIHPRQIPIPPIVKTIRLIRRQTPFLSNRPLPHIPTLLMRPRVTHKRAVLTCRHRSSELLCLRRCPRRAVVDRRRGCGKVFDKRILRWSSQRRQRSVSECLLRRRT
jgi:hypothetical protein